MFEELIKIDNCECGRSHELTTKHYIVKEGAIADLPGLLADFTAHGKSLGSGGNGNICQLGQFGKGKHSDSSFSEVFDFWVIIAPVFSHFKRKYRLYILFSVV